MEKRGAITSIFGDYVSIHLLIQKPLIILIKNKEISEKMKLTPSSVTCMLYKLRALGLILWNPRKPIRLTKRGGEIVRNLNEIKSLLKLLFEDVLGIKEEEMISKLSCEIEHHFTRGLKESLQKFLIESGYL